MAFDHSAARLVCHGQIKQFGTTGILRRDGVDRACIVGVVDYKPSKDNLREAGARRALVSALGIDDSTLITPPDNELDLLVWNGEVLSIVAPVKGVRPAGTVYYYELEVLFKAAA